MDKNKLHIEDVTKLEGDVRKIRSEIAGKYNNREMSLVVTKLQEAEHWLEEYRRVLASK